MAVATQLRSTSCADNKNRLLCRPTGWHAFFWNVRCEEMLFRCHCKMMTTIQVLLWWSSRKSIRESVYLRFHALRCFHEPFSMVPRTQDSLMKYWYCQKWKIRIVHSTYFTKTDTACGNDSCTFQTSFKDQKLFSFCFDCLRRFRDISRLHQSAPLILCLLHSSFAKKDQQY